MFELETARFSAALRLYLEVTSKGLPEALNHVGGDVALRAVQFTSHADAVAIATELGALHAVQVFTKGGTRLKRPRPITKPVSVARAIIVSRLLKKGDNPSKYSGVQIDAMTNKMLAARLRGINVLRAGYLPAARAFGKGGVAGVQLLNPDAGSGEIATVDDLLASITNNVAAGPHWAPGAPAYLRAVAELQGALDFKEKDMLEYIDRKLDEAAKTVGLK